MLLFFAFPAIKMEMDSRVQSTIPVMMDMNARIAQPPKTTAKETVVKKPQPKAAPKPQPKPEPPKEKKVEKPPVVKGTVPVPQKNPDPRPKKEEKPQIKAQSQPQKEQKAVAQEESAPVGMPGDRDEPVTENVVTPVYPKEALNNNWAGTVTLEVHIDKEGKPTYVDIVKSSGHASLDAAFVRTIQNFYTFKPKQVFGKKVSGKLRLSYSFKLD